MPVIIVWLIFLVLKLILASTIPFSPDESYYWVWSQKLALSYYDHPPLIAWLLKLPQIMGLPHWMDRWPILLFGHATLLIWIHFLQKITADSKKQILFLVLVGLHPIMGWGNILAMPDTLLLFFVSLSYFFYIQCLDSKNLKHYLFFGISLGLGFLAKYQVVLLVPPLLAAALLYRRREIKISGLLLTILSGFFVCLPVLLWNYQNDWASFRFQLQHGFSEDPWEFSWTLNYITSQLALISPFILFYAWRSFRDKDSNFFIKSSFFVGAFVLLFFLYSSSKNVVEANWPSLAYLFLYACAFTILSKKALYSHIAFWLVLSSFFIYFASIRPPKKWLEKASEPFVYKEIAEEISAYKPLYGGTYQLASVLWRTYQSPIYKPINMARFDQFDMWPESKVTSKKFFILKFKNTAWPPWLEKEKFTASLLKSFNYELGLFEVLRD